MENNLDTAIWSEDLPSQLRITFETDINGIHDAQWDGDYFLYLTEVSHDRCLWQLDIPAIEGCSRLWVIVEKTGKSLGMRAGATGYGAAPVWIAPALVSLETDFQIRLQLDATNPTSGTGNWPSSIVVISVAGPAPTFGYPIPAEPSAAELAAMAILFEGGSSGECKESEKKNFYAGAIKKLQTPAIVDATAKIRTRKVILDCEHDLAAKWADASFAFVGIPLESGGKVGWAQTGFIRYRGKGFNRVEWNLYAEMVGNSDFDGKYLRIAAFPTDAVHTYKVVLTPATGNWDFYYDGNKWANKDHAWWVGKHGQSADYTGEIHHKQTQMAGIEERKCEYTDCAYSTTTAANVNPAFVNGDLITEASGLNIAAEWGEEVVGAAPRIALNIWDKKKPFSTDA